MPERLANSNVRAIPRNGGPSGLSCGIPMVASNTASDDTDWIAASVPRTTILDDK